MGEQPGISLRQAFWLFVNSRLIITLVFIPAFTEPPHNQDILLSMIAAVPMTMLEAAVFLTLWLKYPNQTLIEYCTAITGKWIGKIIGILYLWYFVLQISITLRQFDEFLVIKFLPKTPMEIIGLSIVIISAYVVYSGLENLGRCADILVPYILTFIVVIVAMVIHQADWKSTTPLLEKGIGPMLQGGIPTTTRWSELAWMAMIIPYIVNKEKLKRAIYGGIALVNSYVLILMAPIVAIFGMEMTQATQFPTYSLVEMISIGEFFERIDAVVLGMWVFGAFLKISVLYYVLVLGLAQWFGLKEKKVLIMPVGILCLILSLLLFPNIVDLRQFGKTSVFYDFTFIFVVPLLLLMVHHAKKIVYRHQQA